MKPHFHTPNTSSCRAAASSSSSMKFSKSILNPIRATRNGGPAVSLSFLSRRLRPNGSLKGGRALSPFFTTKKRGGAFENPEPSSPKVTCIGQVRVKSKKKRSLSKKRMVGEASFRKTEQKTEQECQCWPHKNQRWVHLPISVCEALRAFGAEFSCLFPCRRSSNCVSMRGREKRNENGCGGTVLARCLVFAGEGGRRREIEVVVGGGDEGTAVRRHVFEDIEVKNGRIEIKGRSLEDEEEEIGRVSICIPPKNALLLMRCRSDPMKMAALANRCNWAAPECENEDNEEEDEIVDFEGKDEIYEGFEEGIEVSNKPNEEQKIQNEAEANLEMGFCEDKLAIYSEEKEQEIKGEEEEEEIESNMSSFEALLEESPTCHLSSSSAQSDEEAIDGNDVVSLPDQKEAEETEESTTSEKDPIFTSNDNQNHKPEKTHQQEDDEKEESENPVLPECLLLMMCEPKLSMEVSKETWVRGTDFIRWLPERPRKAAKAAGCDHVNPVKRRPSIADSKPKPRVPAPPSKRNEHQPPRSSCSLPAAASMIERKLVCAGAYEPLALTRCKSEPMRTAAAKLMPEPCFWKNGSVKMEPHGRAALGVGAAGVGF
ncbi:hypothetical protein DH2020_034718 [Rehmannia glutinosa]|uniref:Uncharacterized protein n=1 Tax=Rehmannia glutinosa TaxID=99300 RepID=A0ABR0V9C5_REHGL